MTPGYVSPPTVRLLSLLPLGSSRVGSVRNLNGEFPCASSSYIPQYKVKSDDMRRT